MKKLLLGIRPSSRIVVRILRIEGRHSTNTKSTTETRKRLRSNLEEFKVVERCLVFDDHHVLRVFQPNRICPQAISSANQQHHETTLQAHGQALAEIFGDEPRSKRM